MDVPGYEITEMLGAGGFGTVYRARQLSVQREVALKIDSRTLDTDRDRRRFMREVTAAGRLSGHPHVVAVYDAGLLGDGRPYMVLALCPNGSLNDRLYDSGPFPAAEVRDIGVRIADALAAAHGAGVLHRDVKPANILVDQYGSVALADFGLASMPAPGMESSATREALTPAYAPPEAFQLTEPSPLGDVYSLAASLYALLLGRPPHFPPDGRLGIAALMLAQQRPVPDLPGVAPALTAVLRQAMAYDPAARTPSAAALRDALAAVSLTPAPATVTSRPAAPAHAPAWPQATVPPPPAAPATGWPQATVPPSPGGNWAATQPPGGGWAPNGRTIDPVALNQPGPQVRAPRLKSPGVLILGAAALVTTGIVGGALVIALSGPGGGTPDGSPSTNAQGGAVKKGSSGDVYGVPTVTENCPAATVPGARARCTKTAECWGGIVSMNGNVSINRADCLVSHVYETFAIAPLPSDGQTWNVHELEDHPTMRALCSRTILARSRYGAALKYPAKFWTPDIIPPSQNQYENQGLRVVRCVGRLDDKPPVRGSVFRPRT